MKNLFLIGILTLPATVTVHAWTELPTTVVTNETANYKDSYYYNYGGKSYLAVSDFTNNGISILRDNSAGGDTNFTKVATFPWGNPSSSNALDSTIDNRAYAPTIYMSGSTGFMIYSYWPNGNIGSGMKLRYFTFDLGTFAKTSLIQDVPFTNTALNSGLSDPEIWQTSNGLYLAMSKLEYNPYTNTNGFTLYWSFSAVTPLSFSDPKPLYSNNIGTFQGGANKGKPYSITPIDKWRTDISTKCPNDTNNFHVVEAPRWSFWTGMLYWSVGFSNAYCSDGSQVPYHVHGIRRGSISYATDKTPSINVVGYEGGADDLVSANDDNKLLTHPDFTKGGYIRATGHRNGNGASGQYEIVNTTKQ